MKKSILCLAAILALLTVAGSASATPSERRDRACAQSQSPNHRQCADARVRAVPEIDSTSGTQAIALILGVMLLGAERLRRRA